MLKCEIKCQFFVLFFSLAYNRMYWCSESAYRWEIDHLVTWCRQNNLDLNTLKTVEMAVDYRKNSASLTPIPLFDSVVYTVESAAEKNATCQGLWWCTSTKLSLSPSFALPSQSGMLQLLPRTKADCSVIHSAEKVIGLSLPSIQVLYASRMQSVRDSPLWRKRTVSSPLQ